MKDKVIEFNNFKITLRKDGMVQVQVITTGLCNIIPMTSNNFIIKDEEDEEWVENKGAKK